MHEGIGRRIRMAKRLKFTQFIPKDRVLQILLSRKQINIGEKQMLKIKQSDTTKYPFAFGLRLKYRKRDKRFILTIWLGCYQLEVGDSNA